MQIKLIFKQMVDHQASTIRGGWGLEDFGDHLVLRGNGGRDQSSQALFKWGEYSGASLEYYRVS